MRHGAQVHRKVRLKLMSPNSGKPSDDYSDKVRIAGAVMVLLAAGVRKDLEYFCERNPLPRPLVVRPDQPGLMDLVAQHAMLGRAIDMEARGMRMAGIDSIGDMSSPAVRQTVHLKLMSMLSRMDPVGDVMSA